MSKSPKIRFINISQGNLPRSVTVKVGDRVAFVTNEREIGGLRLLGASSSGEQLELAQDSANTDLDGQPANTEVQYVFIATTAGTSVVKLEVADPSIQGNPERKISITVKVTASRFPFLKSASRFTGMSRT